MDVVRARMCQPKTTYLKMQMDKNERAYRTDKDQGRYVHSHFSECGGVVWLSSSLSTCMHYLLKDATRTKHLESD